MAYDHDSSEFIAPKSTYLDDVEIYDEALGGKIPAWKALIFYGARARAYANSAGAIAAEAQKTASGPKLPPPLAADSIKAKAKKDEAAKMNQVLTGLDALERRLDVLEERKRQQAEDAARAEIAEQALLLAEQIAEETPGAVMDALSPPRPKQRLH